MEALSIKNRVTKQQAIELEKLLTFNRLMPAKEINTTQFGDHRIRSWLKTVEERVHYEAQFGLVESVDEDIKAFFDKVGAGEG